MITRGIVPLEIELLLDTLSTAMWILGTDEVSKVDVAEQMLHFFYQRAPDYFGVYQHGDEGWGWGGREEAVIRSSFCYITFLHLHSRFRVLPAEHPRCLGAHRAECAKVGAHVGLRMLGNGGLCRQLGQQLPRVSVHAAAGKWFACVWCPCMLP